MKKYPTELYLMVFAVVCFTLGALTDNRLHRWYAPHPQNNQSFPFKEVGVVGPSASTSYLKEEFGDEYETIMA